MEALFPGACAGAGGGGGLAWRIVTMNAAFFFLELKL